MEWVFELLPQPIRDLSSEHDIQQKVYIRKGAWLLAAVSLSVAGIRQMDTDARNQRQLIKKS